MIAIVDGIVRTIGDSSLVVMVGGVGLRVFTTATLLKQTAVGSKITLFTYLYVREDALHLYGFETEEEKDFFVLLLGVNGVGPRVAISILSSLSLERMRAAVNNEQSDVFAQVPGIGKKTAQKIIIHLQGKIDAGLASDIVSYDIDKELLEALTALGYSVAESQAAIQALPKDTPQDLESKLRAVLRYFSL